jgi:hypothetical protein
VLIHNLTTKKERPDEGVRFVFPIQCKSATNHRKSETYVLVSPPMGCKCIVGETKKGRKRRKREERMGVERAIDQQRGMYQIKRVGKRAA